MVDKGLFLLIDEMELRDAGGMRNLEKTPNEKVDLGNYHEQLLKLLG